MTTALEGGEGSASRPGLFLPPGEDPVPIVREAGWALGPVWTGAENLAFTGFRYPDCRALSQSLYRLLYPAYQALRSRHWITIDNVPWKCFDHYAVMLSHIQDIHLRNCVEMTGMYRENSILYGGGFPYCFIQVTRWYCVVLFGPLNNIYTYNRLKASRNYSRPLAVTFKISIWAAAYLCVFLNQTSGRHLTAKP
jgi:hypothetical protein